MTVSTTKGTGGFNLYIFYNGGDVPTFGGGSVKQAFLSFQPAGARSGQGSAFRIALFRFFSEPARYGNTPIGAHFEMLSNK